MVYELPAGRAAAARASQGRQPARPGDALRRGGRRPGRRAERRPAVLPRPRAVPPQRDRRRRAEHLLDQRTFLDRLARLGPPRHPRRPGHDDRGRRRATSPSATRSPTATSTPSSPTRAPTCARYQADWLPWLDELKAELAARHRHRPARHAAGVVGAAAGDGPDAAGRRRRGVPAARRRRRGAHRLPRRRGPARTPARTHRFRFDIDRAARRDGRRRAGRRLEQLAVPVVPLPGVARRRVQRVGLQLLQVAVGRADAPHRGRGRAPARPADGDRARHRARRLDRPAPLPAPQRRPRGVRRDRRAAR